MMQLLFKYTISSLVAIVLMTALSSCTSEKNTNDTTSTRIYRAEEFSDTKTIANVKAILLDVETYIDERPDSALATLLSITRNKIHGKPTRALYNLLIVEALEKCDSIITDMNAITPALDYYSRGKDHLHYFQALFYFGCIQKDSGNYSGATVTFCHAEELAEKIDNNPHWMGLLYSQLSSVCGMCYDSEEENRYALLSYENFLKTGNKRRIQQAKFYLSQSYHDYLSGERQTLYIRNS